MREFNTSGPCDPKLHYTVMREELVKKGLAKIEKGKYFTIFAPRQTGKTTYFQLLIARLLEENKYIPICLSFENCKTFTPEMFYDQIEVYLNLELKENKLISSNEEKKQIKHITDLDNLFVKFKEEGKKEIVLIIDEFEGIPDSVVSEVMHTFRKMYHQKKYHCLYSLILVGVSNLPDIVMSSTSPFNIADEIKVPYFTKDEVYNLIEQHTNETGQKFDKDVIESIYFNTQGQPGLVNALCQYLTDEIVTDRSEPVNMNAFYKTLTHFLTERRDKNISNIVNKAMQKRELMFKILFEEEVPFTVNDPDIAFLHTHGVIDNREGFAEVSVPIYSKVLITTFRPLYNGEKNYYITSAKEDLSTYLLKDGINLKAILDKYSDYVRKRGFKAFDTEHLKEGAWHYSLDGFINFFIDAFGGQTFIETPIGRGRTDILIIYNKHKYIIETKVYRNSLQFEKGKKQLSEYLKSENLDCGYYVVFSNKHTDKDDLYFEEEIEGKKIYTWIIRTNFNPVTE